LDFFAKTPKKILETIKKKILGFFLHINRKRKKKRNGKVKVTGKVAVKLAKKKANKKATKRGKKKGMKKESRTLIKRGQKSIRRRSSRIKNLSRK